MNCHCILIFVMVFSLFMMMPGGANAKTQSLLESSRAGLPVASVLCAVAPSDIEPALPKVTAPKKVSRRMLLLKGSIQRLTGIAMLSLLLLGPTKYITGGIEWEDALVLIKDYAIIGSIGTALLAFFKPASLEVRLGGFTAETQPQEDKIVTALLICASALWASFISIDVHYFRFEPLIPPKLKAFGHDLLKFGCLLAYTALYQNEYAAPIIKDQTITGINYS